MIFKKIFLLFALLCPIYNHCSTPQKRVPIRKCNTLRISRSSFFEAFNRQSEPGAKGDEAQVLAELCSRSSMPWKIMQFAAQRAVLYPRSVRSKKFSHSSDFAQTVADCITDEGINTQKLENKYTIPAFTKLLWSAAGAIAGFSCALAYMKYTK